jgi:cell division control protein 6
VIRDRNPLDFTFIPPRTPHREAQLGELRSHFAEVVRGGSQNAFLHGPIGSGKTMGSHVFGDWLSRRSNEEGSPVKPIYVNCHNRRSDHGVLLHMLRHFEERFPDRGFNPDIMMNEIRKHVEKRGLRLLVVLDEADWLHRDKSQTVYWLTRFTEDTGKPNPISVIMISTRAMYEFMEPAAMSTFKSNIVKFGRYARAQLEDILRDRAEYALYEGSVPDDVLSLIAASAAERGDARRAIELLERSAHYAQESGLNVITPEHVRSAKGDIEPVISSAQLEELDLHPRMALLGIARALRRKAETTTGEAERCYSSVCEEFGQARRAHTQFWKYVRELQSRGLIVSTVSGRGQQGKTTLIELRDIPAETLAAKLEEMLYEETKE